MENWSDGVLEFWSNEESEYLAQRRKGSFAESFGPFPEALAKGKGREEKDCHFERREKSFLDPAHSLGMTGFGLSLGDLGVLARGKCIRNSMPLK
jgi:hypothetical protein